MTATVIRRAGASQSGKIHYLANASVVDGGAQVFDAYIENDGGSAFVRLCKTSPQGVTVDMPPVRGPENSKVDGVALVQSGRDLHVRMTSHVGDLNTMLSVEVLQGACIPYGASGPQLAKEGAFVPTGSTPPPTPTPTLTVEDIMAAMRAEFGGSSNDIRQGLEDKNKDAIKELNLWSGSLQERGLDRYIMDRVFQCLTTNWPDKFPIPRKPEQPIQEADA